MNRYEMIDKAIQFAIDAHAGQIRKDGTPFILHPLEDAAIVSTVTHDPDMITAAILHDTVEDTGTTPQDILNAFGQRVYTLVMSETEDKRADLPPADTWQIRKEESLQILADSHDEGVKILWLGDKLSNIRALYRSHEQKGVAAFDVFNIHDPLAHKWYFGRILDLLQSLSDTCAYKEYADLYHKIFDVYEGEK